MPRVFEREDVPDKIPCGDSFNLIEKLARVRLAKDAAIMGALIFGSVPHRSFKPTSNIDILVVYDPRFESGQPEILRSLARQARKVCVPIDYRIVDVNMARLGTHGIDYSLRSHLKFARDTGHVIKKDPLPLINFTVGTSAQEFFAYLQHKIGYFETRLALLEEDDFDQRFFEAVIETPLHLLRKMLPVLGIELALDAEQTVIQSFSKIATAEEYSLFERCRQIEFLYLEELKSQTVQRDCEAYQCILRRIRKTAPFTLKFLKAMADRVLRSAIDDPLYNPQLF